MNKKISNNKYYMYGKHACISALSNKNRKIHKIIVTSENLSLIPNEFKSLCETITNKDFYKFLPIDAVHQGIAIQVSKLNNSNFLPDSYTDNTKIAILDQVTDPHNLGAILRNAAAFNIEAIIIPSDNSPEESAIVAKSASGALELVPVYRVVNISTCINQLKNSGFWVIGLDGEAKEYLSKKTFEGKSCLVLGAEGKGLRRLTKENCDSIVKIHIDHKMESLNVSVASAIAFYESSK